MMISQRHEINMKSGQEDSEEGSGSMGRDKSYLSVVT